MRWWPRPTASSTCARVSALTRANRSAHRSISNWNRNTTVTREPLCRLPPSTVALRGTVTQMPSRYTRFDIRRPDYLAEVHWDSISIEIDRLTRSLDADDDGQVLADAKCLVESVAKVTHEIAGEPAPESLKSLVSGAHELLRGQPGHELERATPFAQIANSANKMAQQLGEIRNAFGGGHGRAQQPRVRSEAVDLALDAAFTWTRWALRRLGLFSEGRPEALIRDLIVESATFRSGTLKRRLEAANLGTLEARHQRALGVAVGQRVMRNTFVVREDGLEPALLSDDRTTGRASRRASCSIRRASSRSPRTPSTLR